MRMRLAVLAPAVLALALAAPVAAQRPGDAAVAVTNVTVIDVARGRSLPGRTVVTAGDRIVAVGPACAVRVPAGARHVDGRGMFLIPGLWDMHVHVFNNRTGDGTHNAALYFPAFVANGVLGVRDMFTDLADVDTVRAWTARAASGALLAPRVFASSTIVDGAPATWPHLLVVRDAAEARRAVDSLADAGAPVVKVYEALSREAYFAIAARAKERGVPFAGHVPEAVSHREASEAGQRSIEHVAGGAGSRVLSFCSARADSARRAIERLRAVPGLSRDSARTLRQLAMRDALDRHDPRDCAPLFAAFARNGTRLVPTLVQAQFLPRADDAALLTDPRLAYVTAGERRDWQRYNMPPAGLLVAEDFRLFRSRFDANVRLVGQMHRAGVPLLAGTDVGNPFVYPGFSLHDELALLVRAGLPPAAALRAATLEPARYLGAADTLGSIAVGKRADLVLLAGDPLADIANTRRIRGVVARGRYLPAPALDSLLAAARDAAASRQ